MNSITSRHIALGAGAVCLLALAAPLSAQQPARQPADTTCAVAEAGQIAMRDTNAYQSEKAMGKKADTAAVKADKDKNKSQDGKAVAECRNQTQSGVTDSSGASTLGPGVKTATPDQNQPVMSKGDTLKKAGDPNQPDPSSYKKDTTSGYKTFKPDTATGVKKDSTASPRY